MQPVHNEQRGDSHAGLCAASAAGIAVVIETARLRLRLLTDADAAFILELVNEPGWLRFIGDRDVHDHAGALRYMQTGPQAMYKRHGFGLYCVELRQDAKPIGLCGLVKREGLEHADLGFAFLARHQGQGYAREAAAASLLHARRDCGLSHVAAITNPDNQRSIHLLEELGFEFLEMRNLSAGAPPVRVFLWRADAPAARV